MYKEEYVAKIKAEADLSKDQTHKVLTLMVKMRKQKKLTQKQMADELGMSSVCYGRWENGKTEILVKNIFRVCDVLQIHPRDFLIKALDSK